MRSSSPRSGLNRVQQLAVFPSICILSPPHRMRSFYSMLFGMFKCIQYTSTGHEIKLVKWELRNVKICSQSFFLWGCVGRMLKFLFRCHNIIRWIYLAMYIYGHMWAFFSINWRVAKISQKHVICITVTSRMSVIVLVSCSCRYTVLPRCQLL
jgi:hypothetical protein